jgi:hypothetical protein
MQKFPSTFLKPKDARDTQRDRNNFLPAGDFRLEAFDSAATPKGLSSSPPSCSARLATCSHGADLESYAPARDDIPARGLPVPVSGRIWSERVIRLVPDRS